MRLLLDHHYSPRIAEGLRALHFDAVTAAELGWETEPDERLLEWCAAERTVLMTNNVVDFAPLVRRWSAEGRSHSGLVFTSDSRLPRRRDTIGRYVELLVPVFEFHPDRDDFVDLVHWL